MGKTVTATGQVEGELVSVLIPAYNPAYFRQSLESALDQTYTNTEIIVCDDSPGDEISSIAGSLEGEGAIRYLRNERNLGARSNYLKCFEHAAGSYIKFLNDDDLLLPECVSRMVAVLEDHKEVSLVTSRRQLIDAKGYLLPDAPYTVPLVNDDAVLTGLAVLNLLLHRRSNFIGEPTTAMFRRRDLDDVKPDIMSFAGRPVPANLDIAMWLNLLLRGDLAYLAEPLSQFRVHGEQEQQKESVIRLCEASWNQVIEDAGKMGILQQDGIRGSIRGI